MPSEAESQSGLLAGDMRRLESGCDEEGQAALIPQSEIMLPPTPPPNAAATDRHPAIVPLHWQVAVRCGK